MSFHNLNHDVENDEQEKLISLDSDGEHAAFCFLFILFMLNCLKPCRL